MGYKVFDWTQLCTLDVILKENEKEETVNIWDIFEPCPFKMLPPSMASTTDIKDIEFKTTR